MKKFLTKNERYIKTFFEGFASYIALNVATTDFSSNTAIKGLIVGAIATGFSILFNIRKKEELETQTEPVPEHEEEINLEE